MAELNHEDIARLAYRLWQERGSPIGSPAEDWVRAEAELRRTSEASVEEFPVFAVAMGPSEQ